MTKQRLIAEVKGGKSVAQLAAAKGKPIQGLLAAQSAALRAAVAKGVVAGVIPKREAAAILARARQLTAALATSRRFGH
jgi:hypothetical protein